MIYLSYRIEYDRSVGKYQVRKDRSPIIPALAGLLFFAILIFFPGSREEIVSLLIPGEDSVTVTAFHTMTDDLRSGAGIYDAFWDFCSVVIHES